MKKFKFIEPILITAGDPNVKLGEFSKPPLVDCRILSEDTYQFLKLNFDEYNLLNFDFIEPILIKAGDKKLKLGSSEQPPLVDCRVLSEDTYQFLKTAYDIFNDVKIQILCQNTQNI